MRSLELPQGMRPQDAVDQVMHNYLQEADLRSTEAQKAVDHLQIRIPDYSQVPQALEGVLGDGEDLLRQLVETSGKPLSKLLNNQKAAFRATLNLVTLVVEPYSLSGE